MKIKTSSKFKLILSFILTLLITNIVFTTPISAAEGDLGVGANETYTWQISSVNNTVYPHYEIGDKRTYQIEGIQYSVANDLWYLFIITLNFEDEAEDIYHFPMSPFIIYNNGSEVTSITDFIPNTIIPVYLMAFAVEDSRYNASGTTLEYTSGNINKTWVFNEKGVMVSYTEYKYNSIILAYTMPGESISFGGYFLIFLFIGLASSIIIYKRKVKGVRNS